MTYNNKDGEVITRKADKEITITYLDFNEYKKLERALKVYLLRTYKELVFKVSSELRKENQPNGNYELELYTDEKFKKVYGAIKLHYYVQNNHIVIINITPNEILKNLHKVIPNAYKGVPYTNEKELFRIKMILGE